ncbi:MAG: hypothetical protein C5B53_05515 [Candidatus Melainabacteria bacterium]|nr:MAG: hypothetical protein C5B53_05515 [Candidatus Melainabacteria bacterium]
MITVENSRFENLVNGAITAQVGSGSELDLTNIYAKNNFAQGPVWSFSGAGTFHLNTVGLIGDQSRYGADVDFELAAGAHAVVTHSVFGNAISPWADVRFFVDAAAAAEIDNSTITGSTADGLDVVSQNGGTVQIVSNTVLGNNTSGNLHGDVYALGAAAQLDNNIIGNLQIAGAGAVTSNGYNLITSTNAPAADFVATDLIGVAPQVTLVDNTGNNVPVNQLLYFNPVTNGNAWSGDPGLGGTDQLGNARTPSSSHRGSV